MARKTKKRKVIRQLNMDLIKLIRQLFTPAISASQADQIIWIIDLYEVLSETMPIRLHELEAALAHLNYVNIKINNKVYYFINNQST